MTEQHPEESAESPESAGSPENAGTSEETAPETAPAPALPDDAPDNVTAVVPADVVPDPEPLPGTIPQPEPVPHPDPLPAPQPEPVPSPDPLPAPQPEPVPSPDPPSVPVPHPAPPSPTAVVPGPGPVPTPAVVAPPAAPAPAVTGPPPSTDSTADLAARGAAWGRVGEDGTVFLRTGEGERAVGSYPGAGDEEALAYFVRKFDELEGQIALLEQRVEAGGVAPKDADASIGHLREGLVDAHAVGDLAALSTRLDALAGRVEVRRKEAEAARVAARERAKVVKERIVVEAEGLAESTDWKRTGDRLRTLLEDWKKAPRLDRKTDDALWKRFSHARTAFDKSRRAHFAELDVARGEASQRKEKLIKEAEELSSSTDWGPTARRYRDLMTEWKAAGRARRDVEDALWGRFRAAQDTFFAARSEVFSARDADLAVNLETKRALLVEAERLVPVSDARSARTALRGILEKWEAAGHVPRGDRDAIENRLRAVDDTIRAAEEQAWKRSNPEARARAEATVGQLRTSIAALDAEAEAAAGAGQESKATKAREAAAARREWLAEAERTLAEFS